MTAATDYTLAELCIVAARTNKAAVRVTIPGEEEPTRVAGDQKYDAISLTVNFVAESSSTHTVVITNSSKCRGIPVVLGLFQK